MSRIQTLVYCITACVAFVHAAVAAENIQSTPLTRDASPVDASTRFLQLDSKATGIVLSTAATSRLAEKKIAESTMYFREDSYSAIAIADLNQDQRPDIIITHPYGGMQLFQNQGDLRFKDVTREAGLHAPDFWGRGANPADLDNDGDLDLFVAGNGEANRLYWNQGNSIFEAATSHGLNHKDPNVCMAFADYDLDGDLDGYLVVGDTSGSDGFTEDFKMDVEFRNGKAIIPPEFQEVYDVLLHPQLGPQVVKVGQNDHLYRNNGDGTFTDVTKTAGISGPGWGLAASWLDYNHDGWPDIYVANDFYTPDKLYHNNGNGTFTDVIATVLPHTPWFSMGTDVADINNDGLMDFIGTDMSGSTHYKSKMGMGDMEKSSWFLTLPTPRQYMRNALYLNTGTHRFMEIAQMAGVANTDWTWTPKFADLDNDGWIDLFFTNGMTRDLTNSDYVNQAAALKTHAEKRAFWKSKGRKKDRNLAFRNHGDLRFESVGKAWGLDAARVSFGAATADLDGDGDLDLITTNLDEPVSVYRNQSVPGEHRVKIRLKGTQSNRWGVGARVELKAGGLKQLRYLNLTQGYISSSEPLLHFGLGKVARIDGLTVHWPSGVRQVLTNLAADRFYTITEPEKSEAPPPSPPLSPSFISTDRLSSVVHREDTFDDFKLQPLLPNKLSQLGPGMAWADVDGDEDADLFTCGATDQASSLWLQQADGKFQAARNNAFDFFAKQEDLSALFFEFNGDGAPDLYVVSGGSGYQAGSPFLHDRLYLNDGRGNFRMAKSTTPRITDSGGPVAAADFDRDGDLDWFVGGRFVPGAWPTAPTSHLVQNEHGTSTRIVTDERAPGLAAAGMVTAALWTDMDADGWIDLLVAHEWGAIRLWHNDKGTLREIPRTSGLPTHSGWWNGLAAGDVDNDGDMDFAASNFGLNTKYHASVNQPVIAHYGDMDGSGVPRFIEASYEQGTLFPVRGRSCSSRAIPGLAVQFPDFDSFARAPLIDIYPKHCLANALRLEVNTLESGVFLNDGSGRFTFKPLPRLAQTSPGFGLALTDVNEDGDLDLYMVQNFYGPQPETGHMDGGVSLLLYGNGDGTFEPIMPHRSGLVVPGDAKGLSLVDLNRDARPDFVVAINNGAMMSFERQMKETPNTLRLRLKGPPGNPTCIGTRVTVEFENGSKQTAEVRAGGSYLSQSYGPLIFTAGNRSVKGLRINWPNGQRSSIPFTESKGEFEIEMPKPSP